MRIREVPVLIVGAGPVGLSTALFLVHWGVPTLVVDKRDATWAAPRASSSVRTVELFRSLGLQEAIEQVGWLGHGPMTTVFKDDAFGATLHRGDLPPRYSEWLRRCSPVDFRLVVTQQELQKVALDELRRRGGEVLFDTALVDYRVDEQHVCAGVVDATGEQWTIIADYLIGADGANSLVRQQLGVTVPDRDVVARLNTAFYRADLGPIMDEWRSHMCFVRNARVYATIFSKNGRDQWSSHIMDYPGKPDELIELTAEETVELLRAAIGDDTIPIELIDVKAWEAAIGLASAFRQGRVFLAGDAAHVQSSAGGLGMNTGIQDGHNLAWKLAEVIHGHATSALLDTYEPERRAAAGASLALSRDLHTGYRSLDGGDPNRLYEHLAGAYVRGMLRYGYRSTAIISDDQDDAAAPDVLSDVVVPGYRLPHHWLNGPDGRTVSTIDLAGAHWTVLSGSHGQAWLQAAAVAGSAVGIDLQAQQIQATPSKSPVTDHQDTTAHETQPIATDAVPGIAPAGAALIRPDGFVAWRAPDLGTDPQAALQQALITILRLRRE